MGDVDNGEGHACVVPKDAWEISLYTFPLIIYVNLQMLYKNEVLSLTIF